MNTKLKIILTFVLCGGPALAREPAKLGDDIKHARAGMPVFGHNQYIKATGQFVRTGTISAGTSPHNRAQEFEYGTQLVIVCDADVIGYFLADTAATTSTTGWVADSGSTAGRTEGAGGFRVEADVPRHVISPYPKPQRGAVEDLVSKRTSGCTSTTQAVKSKIYGRPCDADADCAYAAATCSTSVAPRSNLLKIHPVSGTATCWVDIEH